MSAVVLDVAMSIDGFWADESGNSIFPVEEMHQSGLIAPLVLRTGAVVMSKTSFDMADDPDWFAGNYEYQVPICVFGGDPPETAPLENERIGFTFFPDFTAALAAARQSCGARDVMVIGEASAAQSALASGEVDEIYLRLVPVMLKQGIPLFDDRAMTRDYRRTSVTLTDTATHIHLTAM